MVEAEGKKVGRRKNKIEYRFKKSGWRLGGYRKKIGWSWRWRRKFVHRRNRRLKRGQVED